MAMFTPDPPRDEDNDGWTHEERPIYGDPEQELFRAPCGRMHCSECSPRRRAESFPTDASENRMVGPKVEAAGIEPACESPPNVKFSSTFTCRVELADYVVAVEDGQLFIYEPSAAGFSELLETALPKLEAITRAARLAQEVSDESR